MLVKLLTCDRVGEFESEPVFNIKAGISKLLLKSKLG